jgi:hypothetical protein
MEQQADRPDAFRDKDNSGIKQKDAFIEKDISDIKQHVVQIESVLTYVLICMVALVLADQSKNGMLVWATAIVSLGGIGQVMRVRNPASRIRDRMLNVTNGAAAGMGLGLALDTAFGFMTLGGATALGGLFGGALGALAPVSSQAPVTTFLTIDSTPPNADIEIDGYFVGSTLSIVPLTAGEHTITVKKDGHNDWTRKLKLAGGNVHLKAELRWGDPE